MKRLGIGFLLTCVLLCGCQPSAPTVASTQTTTATTTAATTTTTAPTTTTTFVTTTSTTKRPTTTRPPAPSADAVLIKGVPYINQNAKYPTGCESVSAVMALQYWGYNISVDTFIDNYLPRGAMPRKSGGKTVGCDPYEKFPGNPRTTAGYGCFSPVIYRCISAIIGSSHEVSQLSNIPLSRLCEQYIQNGIPVLIWATARMRRAFVSARWETETGKQIEWKSPMHCLLLVGYDDDYYYFNDPQTAANTRYSRAACEAAYAAQGMQAVVIFPKTKPTTTVDKTTTVTTAPTATVITTTTVTTVPVSSTSTDTTTVTMAISTTSSKTATLTSTTTSISP